MIIAIGSRKASPGVTTLTTLLAAYWHEENATRLIVEADPSGGTLAARWQEAHDLTWDPGLVAMSANRGKLDGPAIGVVSQTIGEGLQVAAAPPAPHQVSAALAAMGEKAAASLAAAPDVRAFVDCGRLSMASPAMPLARRAALTVLVCRPNLEEVHTLLPGVVELSDAGCALGLVVVGDGPYHPTEIADAATIELLGHVPYDDRAVQTWNLDGLHAGRAFRKSPLARTMSDLASLIADRCARVIAPDALMADTPPADDMANWPPSSVRSEPVGFAALVGPAEPSTNGTGSVTGSGMNGASDE